MLLWFGFENELAAIRKIGGVWVVIPFLVIFGIFPLVYVFPWLVLVFAVWALIIMPGLTVIHDFSRLCLRSPVCPNSRVAAQKVI